MKTKRIPQSIFPIAINELNIRFKKNKRNEKEKNKLN
jgi:hypothetical protein